MMIEKGEKNVKEKHTRWRKVQNKQKGAERPIECGAAWKNDKNIKKRVLTKSFPGSEREFFVKARRPRYASLNHHENSLGRCTLPKSDP